MSASTADEHGGRVVEAARRLGCRVEEVLDLSANLNPFAPDVAAVVAEVVRDEPWRVTAYPDERDATSALATAIGVDGDRVVLTNGAADAIAVLATLRPVGDVVDPEFSLYRRHLAEVRPGAERWRSDPSVPEGRLAVGRDEPAAASGAGTVWDESYHGLATGRWTAPGRRGWRLGSLTKVWRCPGLRLGYVLAPTARDASAFRRRRPAWAVGGVGLAVIERLVPATDLPAWSRSIVVARGDLVDVLSGRGLDVVDTDAPWVLVRDAGHLVRPLLERRVLVRELTGFGRPGHLRVAVPDASGLDRLAGALATIGTVRR